MKARTLAWILAGAALAVVLAAAAPPARADGPRVSLHLGINVPARLYVHEVESYQPYYMGQVYFAPHHHAHVVYAFPVSGRYVPHVYCNHALIRTGYVPTYDPRYDDRAAGYGAVVWDGYIDPVRVGINLRFGQHYSAPVYVQERTWIHGRPYPPPYSYDRYARDEGGRGDKGRRRGHDQHQQARDCDHD